MSDRHSQFYNQQILGGQRRDSPVGKSRGKLRASQRGAMDAGGTGEFRAALIEWATSKGFQKAEK